MKESILHGTKGYTLAPDPIRELHRIKLSKVNKNKSLQNKIGNILMCMAQTTKK